MDQIVEGIAEAIVGSVLEAILEIVGIEVTGAGGTDLTVLDLKDRPKSSSKS